MTELDWDKANRKPIYHPSDNITPKRKKAPIKQCQKCGTYFSSWKSNARYCYTCYLGFGKTIKTKKQKRTWKRQKHFTKINQERQRSISKRKLMNVKYIAARDTLW